MRLKSLATTVVTPAKCVGRLSPSNGSGTQTGLSGTGDVISASPGLANPSYKPVENARSFDLDAIKLNAGFDA